MLKNDLDTQNPLVTVVTVTYNAESSIGKTVKSVISQTFKDYEYLIVDGNSNDKTVQIISEYISGYPSVTMRIISEPDEGIYDAMNKALLMAKGHWIIYLNSGDIFHDNEVLNRVFRDKYDYMVIYGDAVYEYRGKYYRRSSEINMIKETMTICHQSIFMQTDILRRYKFDTDFKYCADYDLILRLIGDGVTFHNLYEIICIYNDEGASENNRMDVEKEIQMIKKNYKVNTKVYIVDNIKHRIKALLRDFAILHLPKLYFSERRGWFTSIDKAIAWKHI